MAESHDVTLLLRKVSDGDETAPDKLLPLVYDEFRKLASQYMENEREDHTLQATALVHEAYIRLVDWENVSWKSRAHFFAVAAQVMRKILVDHARKKKPLNEISDKKSLWTIRLVFRRNAKSI
jgi:RNA polymerase sigma factor (TIGR02999 family)